MARPWPVAPILAALVVAGCAAKEATAPPAGTDRRNATYDRPAADSPKTLVLVCNEWWPYTGPAGSDREGFAVDLVREALGRMGYRLEYRTRPWARCVKEMKEGRVDGVLAAYRVAGRDWLFGEVPLGLSPDGDSDFVVIRRRGSGWKFRGPDSLRTARLAVAEGYHYPEPIEGRLYRGDRRGLLVLSDEDPTLRMLQAVAAGRADALVENRAVVEAALARNPRLRDAVEEAGTLGSWRVYVQLRPDLPGARRILRELDRSLRAIYRSSQFPRILARYGLQPKEVSSQ